MKQPIRLLLIILLMLSAGSAFAQSFRLVHKYEVSLNEVIQKSYGTDSVWYSYSGGRGYDSLRGEWQSDYYADYSLTSKMPHTEIYSRYDSNNRKTGTSLFGISFTTPITYILGWQDTFLYDNVTGLLKEQVIWANVKDSNNNYYLRKNYVHYYYYDAQSRLILDSMIVYSDPAAQVPRPNKSIQYVYNGNGLLEYRTINKYTSPNPATISETDQSHYVYNSAGQMLADTIRGADSTQIPDIMTVIGYRYNSKGQIDKDSIETFSVNGNTMWYRTYNYSSNDLLQFVRWTDSVFNTDDKIVYYQWEAYWPNSIEKIAKEELHATVYPNPASGLVNIKATLKGDGEVRGSITDMQGRVLQRWSEQATTDYVKQLSTSQLSSGIYYISLKVDDKMVTKQFIVQ